MKADKSRMSTFCIVLIVMPIIIALVFLGEIIYLNNFNSTQRVITGTQATDGVSMTIGGRDGSTSEWLKRNFDLYGKTVDLTAQTVDGRFDNNSGYQVGDWQLRLEITGDCFLNQMWCGNVEIHQNVNGTERVQTLDLRNCSTDELTLDFLYDGDILIPLSKGDYLIYYPSDQDGEKAIDKGKSVTIGFILYYLETPELDNYEVTFHFNRTIKDGYNIRFILTALGVWLILAGLYGVSNVTYRRAVKAMKLKESGIRCLSDIYSIIYIIDLVNDKLVPVFADEESEKLRPHNLPASEQLRNMFEYDCAAEYKEMAQEFSSLETIKERLRERNTIAFEYLSTYYGWCQIRFFAMERDEDGIFEKVIFTIQNINDEKKEIENITNRANEAEYESKAKSVFLANMSHEIRTPINTVIGLNTMILRESKEPAVKAYAKNIRSASNMLLSIINGILDMSKLEADKMELVNEEYSFRQLVIDIVSMVKMRTEFRHLEFKCEISEKTPDGLRGDQVRLKQVITNLITNAAKYTDEGSVTLSVYSKKQDGHIHLLVSVKDTGIGIREEDLEKLAQRFTRFDEKRNHTVEGSGIGLNLVTEILKLMGSELHVLSTYGEGSEFYFEIDQEIVDEACVGQIDFNAGITDDEDYQALFTAPDARILVVDDNTMNLKVFCELLKQTQLQIDTVDSGAEALKKDEDQKYDLIFMDHMMPGMDGVETLHRLRSRTDGKNVRTPVIILTANAMKGAKEEYQKEGFQDFIAKPIQAELLEKKIVEYLEPSKVSRGAAVEVKKTAQEELPVISGVDTVFGVNHTGGIKNYLSILEQFINVGEAELDELMSYVAEIENATDKTEAVKSFRIKVHSMKTSANMIGALQIYGVAAMLENAAKHDAVKEILDVVPYFAQGWKELFHAVEESLPKAEVKKQKPTEEELDSQIQLLEQSIAIYDIKNADSAMEKLKSFEFDSRRTSIIKNLESAVAALDADKVIQLCDEFRKNTEE